MRFKDWLLHEARFKGFQRMIRQRHADWPAPVVKDLYDNRWAYAMRHATNNPMFAPTTSWSKDQPSPPQMSPPNSTASMIMQHQGLTNFEWTPKPVVVNLTPLHFDDNTQRVFLTRRFGYEVEPQIRDDQKRMEKQLNLLQLKGPGQNEPIIMVVNGNKYKLLEGWHRTMNYLVYPPRPDMGAPPDQIDLLKKNGDVRQIDFTRWRPVPIQAWIGKLVSTTA